MAERDTSRDIDQAASAWAARLDRASLSPQAESEFQAWLQSDPRCRGAFLRAQAVAMMSESAQALGQDFSAAPPRSPSVVAGLSRRQALTWSGAATAAAAVAFGIGMPAGAVTSTRRGEIRLLPLSDGSTVLLNTESRVRVRYDRGERVVALLKGEAYFSVARDARPFVVEVNGCRLTAVQAGFRVRKLDAAPLDILVSHGDIGVTATDIGAPPQPYALSANTRLTLSQPSIGQAPRLQATRISSETLDRELAWREGKLAFEGETLQQAAASFARYSDTHIVIADSALAREPVTGLFAANDPVGFSRAIARAFDIRLQQDDRRLVLSSRSAPQ